MDKRMNTERKMRNTELDGRYMFSILFWSVQSCFKLGGLYKMRITNFLS